MGTSSRTKLGTSNHYFKSKNGLAHEVLQFYAAAIRWGAPPVGYEIQSWEDLERWFSAQVQLQQRFRMTRGCPFGTIGSGVTENDELIRQDLSLIVGNRLATFFIREKARAPDFRGDQRKTGGVICMAVAQGAMLIGKVAISHLKAFAAKEDNVSRTYACRHRRNLQA